MSSWSIIKLVFQSSPPSRLASVMAIKYDVFGSCVKGINVSVGGININISFAAGGNI